MKYRKAHHSDEPQEYWQSYSDLLAALILTLILILAIVIFNFNRASQELEASKLQYEQQKAESDEASRLYEEARQQVEQQQVELEQAQRQLEAIVGVRREIIDALRAEFEGSNLRISIDENSGSIVFDASVLFDLDSSALRQGGKETLSSFVPKYLQVLLNERFRNYISEIIVEGHTDTQGGYMYNLRLSQDRALSVASFCLSGESGIPEETQNELQPILTANGRSYSDPVFVDGVIDMAQSRRVEIKFRLADEEMIEEMITILNG